MDSKLFFIKTIYASQSLLNKNLKPIVLTIGKFDGIHKGHLNVINNVHNISNKTGFTPALMTFEPYPYEFFISIKGKKQKLIPYRIYSLRSKIMHLKLLGIRQIIIAKFNHKFSQVLPEIFIKKFILDYLNTKFIIVGEDFRFGKEKKGDVNLLYQLSRMYNFELLVIKKNSEHSYLESSSFVREYFKKQSIEKASSLLGMQYKFYGHVIYGKQIGRTLGFPTANMKIPSNCIIKPGVYVGYVYGLLNEPIKSVINLGKRPTFESNGKFLLEAHMLDKKIHAYGKIIAIELLSKLRDEKKFDSVYNLIEAIKLDIDNARNYFSCHSIK